MGLKIRHVNARDDEYVVIHRGKKHYTFASVVGGILGWILIFFILSAIFGGGK